jgi:hypothetical protein
METHNFQEEEERLNEIHKALCSRSCNLICF